MAVIDARKKRSRSLCNFLFCFGLTASPEIAKSHKFAPKNKMMLENAVGAAPAAATGIQPKEKKAKPVNSSFLRWFLKGYDKENKREGSRISQSHYHFRRTSIGSQTKSRVGNSQVVASKYKMQAEPPQVYRIRDRTKVGTRIVHPSSFELDRHITSAMVLQASKCRESCKCVQFRLLMLIVMVLTLLLVVSWITVIICLCTWFYLFPRPRAPAPYFPFPFGSALLLTCHCIALDLLSFKFSCIQIASPSQNLALYSTSNYNRTQPAACRLVDILILKQISQQIWYIFAVSSEHRISRRRNDQ